MEMTLAALARVLKIVVYCNDLKAFLFRYIFLLSAVTKFAY